MNIPPLACDKSLNFVSQQGIPAHLDQPAPAPASPAAQVAQPAPTPAGQTAAAQAPAAQESVSDLTLICVV